MRTQPKQGLLCLWAISALVIQQSCTLAQDQGDDQRALTRRELVVRTAQEFVDVVQDLHENEDTAILIPSGAVLNLTDSVLLRTLPVGIIGTGSLTIRGGNSGERPILHLGWRSDVAVSQPGQKHEHAH